MKSVFAVDSNIGDTINLSSSLGVGGMEYAALYDINGNVLKDLKGETLYGLTLAMVSKLDKNSFIEEGQEIDSTITDKL